MRSIAKIMAAAVALLPFAAPALAQAFPEKPVTLVVPYPPGGNVDSAARLIAPRMEEKLGQPIVVENRAGAAGMIAAEYVKNSDPDGYTLFMAANGPLLFAPMTMNRPKAYDWKTDFAPISSVSITPMALTVRSDLGIKTLPELVERADSDGLLMASPGAGTTNHLAAEKLMAETGKKWRIVHYKGNAPALASLAGGETAFAFDQMSVILPQIKEGTVTPLAVTSKERVKALPDVPTLAETGVVDFQAVTFTGLLAPAGTPKDVVAKLVDAVDYALSDEEVQKRFADLGSDTQAMSPSEFGDFLAEMDKTWRPVVAEVNAKR
ncbi:Bug family tripartite tricarboxylate transporter substrate binding protein [Jiella sonneratiae]|uniref:Tripartite tricarboxylate transporter substrate binding protein n=1 Tax=Jiella sonneratiae TaxID=2816856 RepID=A0ABS3J272_9HYPH|nr:tripartite tricarboxylate transporter substrate binding protein [Jiella sonneratiae]MBO0903762.1 tripartite tricarboxylate transporter substrate binding protein [Jiella sonneratiae]